MANTSFAQELSWYDAHPGKTIKDDDFAKGVGLPVPYKDIKETVTQVALEVKDPDTDLRSCSMRKKMDIIQEFYSGVQSVIDKDRAPEDWRNAAALRLIGTAHTNAKRRAGTRKEARHAESKAKSEDRDVAHGSQDQPTLALSTVQTSPPLPPPAPAASRKKEDTVIELRIDGSEYQEIIRADELIKGTGQQVSFGTFKELVAGFNVLPNPDGARYITVWEDKTFVIRTDAALDVALTRVSQSGNGVLEITAVPPSLQNAPPTNRFGTPRSTTALPSVEPGLNNIPGPQYIIATRKSTPLERTPVSQGKHKLGSPPLGHGDHHDSGDGKRRKKEESQANAELASQGTTTAGPGDGDVDMPDLPNVDAELSVTGDKAVSPPAGEPLPASDLANPADQNSYGGEGSPGIPSGTPSREPSKEPSEWKGSEESGEEEEEVGKARRTISGEAHNLNSGASSSGNARRSPIIAPIAKAGDLEDGDDVSVHHQPFQDKDDELWARDDATGEDVDKEIEKLREAQERIKESVGSVTQKTDLASLKLVEKYFGITPENLQSTTERIRLPSKWLLTPGVGFRPHQLISSAVQLDNDTRVGGGGVGDKMGTGKTHPALLTTAVRIWIARLRKQIMVDKRNRDGRRHLIDESPASNARCPSQAQLPIPCPCQPHAWSAKYPLIPGAHVYFVLPHLCGHWVQAAMDIFGTSKLIMDMEFPVKLIVGHEQTLRSLNKAGSATSWKATALSTQDRSLLARKYDWSAWENECLAAQGKWQEDGITKEGINPYIPEGPAWLDGVAPPEDATYEYPSLFAAGYIIITSPQSFPSRIKSHFRMERKARREKGEGKNHPMSQSSGILLGLCSVYIDEAHNFSREANSHMRQIWETIDAQRSATRKEDGSSSPPFYWILSGTLYDSGPHTILTHFSKGLFRPSWKVATPTAGDRMMHPDDVNASRSEYLQVLEPTAAANFLKRWDKWMEAVKKAADADAVPVDAGLLKTMCEIVSLFVIERSMDVRYPDGRPLIEMARVKVICEDKKAEYDRTAKAIQKDVFATATAEIKKLIEAGKSANFSSTRTRALIVSTTPGLLQYMATRKLADLTLGGTLGEMLKNVVRTHLNRKDVIKEVLRSDAKFHLLLTILKGMPPRSDGTPSKAYIGTFLPITAFVYAVGLSWALARRPLEDHETLTGALNALVLHVHSQMPFPQRQIYRDAINTSAPESRTRFIVSTIATSAEGVNLAGVNYCIEVDPHPEFNKHQQFIARHHRDGQTEPKIYVYQLFNTNSPRDRIVMNLRGAIKRNKAEIDGAPLGKGRVTGSDIIVIDDN